MSGLPASRAEALSVIFFGVFSSLLSETPARQKTFKITLTAAANVWAIASSFLTVYDIMSDSSGIERHLLLFMMGLLALTVITSACALIMMSNPSIQNTTTETYFKVVGLVAIGSTLVFGLVQLYLAYSRGCNETVFEEGAAICEHSRGYVLAAVISAGVLAVVICGIIFFHSTESESSSGVLRQFILPDDDRCRECDSPQSQGAAILNRLSAFVKVCLLGVYWFLVDADLSWNFFMGHDASWWATGQWAKHGAAIANSLLN